ncbi:MAG: hypothetical protein ACOX45_05935 [Acutalibacteraceae bacterium]
MLTDVAVGAASGALAATGVGLIGQIAGNAAISMAGNATDQVIKNKGFRNYDARSMVVDGAIGGVSGAIGGKGANGKALSAAWNSAQKGISREMRRANVKYATKQIAKLSLEKTVIRKTVLVSTTRFALGAGFSYAAPHRW